MGHGGYHGVVKMGGVTVQQGSQSDGQGGQTGGGVYNPGGYANDFDTGQAGDASDILDKGLSPTNPKDAEIINNLNNVSTDTSSTSTSTDTKNLPPGGILQALYGDGAGSIENYQQLLKEGAYDVEGQHPLSQQFIRLTDKYYGGDVEKFAQSSQGQVLLNYLQDVPYTKGGLLGLPTQELADKFEDLGLNVLTEKVLTGDDSDPFKTPTGSDITKLRYQPNFSRSTDIGKRLGALTSDEYKKFNEYLYATRPDLYAQARPFSSGKLPASVIKFLMSPTTEFGKGIANSLLKATGKDPLKETEPFKGITEDNEFIKALTDSGGAYGDQLDFNYLNPALNPNLSSLIQPLDQGGMNDVAQAVINQNETPGLTYEQLLQQYGRPNLIPENLLALVEQPEVAAIPEGGINTFDPNSFAFSIG
jgi:hypothetical protein